MPNYQNGKVYSIRSHQTEEIYIGSTCQTLPERFREHKSKFKRYQNEGKNYVTSFKILEFGDAYIELIEMCPCNNKMELTRREGELIRTTPNCVNKRIAGRTDKEWREDNAEHIKAKKNQWRQDNPEYSKEYNKTNAEKIKEQTKQYRQANAEKLKALKNQKHICPCGGKYTTSGKSQHSKTKKHQAYLEALP